MRISQEIPGGRALRSTTTTSWQATLPYTLFPTPRSIFWLTSSVYACYVLEEVTREPCHELSTHVLPHFLPVSEPTASEMQAHHTYRTRPMPTYGCAVVKKVCPFRSRAPGASLIGVRQMSWIPKFGTKQSDQFNSPMDNEEDIAEVAILKKVMEGRQPTELKLRCKLRSMRYGGLAG